MQEFTKSEYRDLHDGCCEILKNIRAKLADDSPFFFAPNEKLELQAEYQRYEKLADKISHFAWPE